MNSMMMQFVQMQNMIGSSPHSWNASTSNDNMSYQANMSPQAHVQDPCYTGQLVNNMVGGSSFNMNQQMNVPFDMRSSDISGQAVDDNISTRPRARNHLSKMDLMYLPENTPKQRLQGNFDINILKSVEGLLDDEPEQYNSGFSDGNFLNTKKQVRSVESSGFGAAKNSSGWSDTTASKFTKTRKSGNDSSMPSETKFTRSFGDSKINEPKLTSELSTIFENKDGLFFSWQSSGQTNQRTDSNAENETHCEGFRIIPEPKPMTNRMQMSSGVHQDDRSRDIDQQKFHSDFYEKSKCPHDEQKSSKNSKQANFGFNNPNQ